MGKVIYLFVAMLLVMSFTTYTGAQVALLPMGGNVYQYIAVSVPDLHTSPPLMRPIGLGPIASNAGPLTLSIALNSFAEPVDIHLAITAPNGHLYVIKPDKTLEPFRDFGSQKWRTAHSGPINETLFANIPVSDLPIGTYEFYLAVTPAGSTDRASYDNFYLWKTSVVVTPVGMSIRPQGYDFGTVKENNTSSPVTFSLTIPQQAKIEDVRLNNNNDFIMQDNTCYPNTTGACVLTVASRPTEAMLKTTEVEIRTNLSTFKLPLVVKGFRCVKSIDVYLKDFTSSGGTGTIKIYTDGPCSGTVKSDNSWIGFESCNFLFGCTKRSEVRFEAGQSGTAEVSYKIDPNNNSTIRYGTITIENETLVINQAGTTVGPTPSPTPTPTPNPTPTPTPGTCNVTIEPTTQNFSSAGGIGTIRVTAPTGCTWTANLNHPFDSWITITSGSTGTGNGVVQYTVSQNSGLISTTRTGGIRVNDKVLIITQSGGTEPSPTPTPTPNPSPTPTPSCQVTINPSTVNISAAGGTGTLSVSAPSNCGWTAELNHPFDSWITITSGSNGVGNGTVSYRIEPNTSTSERYGGIKVNNQVFWVNQSGADVCSIDISPNSKDFTASGGDVTVSVTTSKDTCQWTAQSNASWITVVSGNSGTGNGQVILRIEQYTGSTARTGTVTIGGKTFTVTQSGCVSIDPMSNDFGAAGGSGEINVTATCNWTAETNSSWITITSGSSGSGSGKIIFTVSANTGGAERQGTITVGGNVFRITQQPCITFTPGSSSFTASGGSGTITVTAAMQSCSWTAQSSDVSWIIITTGASGTGSGTVSFSVSSNGGGSRTGYIEISGKRHEISQEGVSYISYTEILPAVKSAFYTVPPIDPQRKNNPPNYGRHARFFKLTMKPSCSTYMELNIGGNPGGPYNTNTVMSHQDLGSETEWWRYYFGYFANDGVNPNNGVKHNEGVFTGPNLPYYSEMRFNFTATYDAENVRMWNPKAGHVYYFMVVGENEEGTANYRFDWDCD